MWGKLGIYCFISGFVDLAQIHKESILFQALFNKHWAFLVAQTVKNLRDRGGEGGGRGDRDGDYR